MKRVAVTAGVIAVCAILLAYGIIQYGLRDRPWQPADGAVAYVAVRPVSHAALSDPGTAEGREDMEILKMSYVVTAQQEAVLIRAICEDVDSAGRRLDRIRQTTYFADDRAFIIRRLQRDIKVVSVPDTDLIEISMTAADRTELPEIVNAVADALVAEVTAAATRDRTGQIATLQAELNALQHERSVLRQNVEVIRGASEVPMMGTRQDILYTRLHAFSAEMTELELSKAMGEAALKALTEQEMDGMLASGADVLDAIHRDPAVMRLRGLELDLRIELETAAALKLKDTEKVKHAEARLKVIQKMLAARKKEVVARQIASMKERAQAKVVAITERLLETRSQYNEAVALARDLAVSLARIEQYLSQEQMLLDDIKELRAALLRARIALKTETAMELRALAEEPTR